MGEKINDEMKTIYTLWHNTQVEVFWVQTSCRTILEYLARSSEASVSYHITKRCHNTEDLDFNFIAVKIWNLVSWNREAPEHGPNYPRPKEYETEMLGSTPQGLFPSCKNIPISYYLGANISRSTLFPNSFNTRIHILHWHCTHNSPWDPNLPVQLLTERCQKRSIETMATHLTFSTLIHVGRHRIQYSRPHHLKYPLYKKKRNNKMDTFL